MKAVNEVHSSGKRNTHNKHTEYTHYTQYTDNKHSFLSKGALDEIHKSVRRNTQKQYTKYTKALDEIHKRFFKPLKIKGKSGGEKINTFNTIKTFKGRISPPLKRGLCYNTYEIRNPVLGLI